MTRWMGVDYGEKRIGVAISDPTHLIARPLTIVEHRSRNEDFQRLARLIAGNDVDRVIVGYPLSLRGEDGPQAHTVRRWAGALARTLLIPVELWDETLSTVEAHGIVDLNAPRRSRAWKERGRIDAVAAATILQSYLDAHREA